jgi:hypothetical protein
MEFEGAPLPDYRKGGAAAFGLVFTTTVNVESA